MTYGAKITLTRSDLPSIELTVDMPEIDRDLVASENPAFKALFNAFDVQIADLLGSEGKR